MENNHTQNLKDSILDKINSRELSMRPRVYFTLKVAATVLTAGAVLLASIFIFNFIFFSLRINHHDALLGFGPRGFRAFLGFFPWALFFLDIGLLILLHFLLKHFKFAYKIPSLYLISALLLASFAVGLGLDRTPLNDHFLRRSDEHGLPGPFNGFYEHARSPHPQGDGVCTCTITAIEGNTLFVKDSRGEKTILRIILPENDPRATTTSLRVGDTVLVAGDEAESTIRAYGVRKIGSGAI
ncbi:MAG: hypothetical protein JWN89_648 [Parcubacteria group bacterium]|nr:hypothetical protein [Parcubacteria group bacterium]